MRNKIMKIVEQNPKAECSDLFECLSRKLKPQINSVRELVVFLNARNLLPGHLKYDNMVSELIDGCEDFKITAPIDVIGDNESVLEL